MTRTFTLDSGRVGDVRNSNPDEADVAARR
jgi:hypothetical protein